MQPPQKPPNNYPQGGWPNQPQQPQGGQQGGWQQPPQQPQGGQQGGWQQPPQGQPPNWQQGGGGWQQQPDPYYQDPGYTQPPRPPGPNWLLIGAGAVGAIFLCLIVVLVFIVIASNSSDDKEPTAVVNVGTPSVTITTPTTRQEFQVGTTITVQAAATDAGTGVTRVELLANNVVVDSQTSQNPQGEKNLAVLLDYTAAVPMEDLILTVRAYRGVVRGTDASVSVRVLDRNSTGAATNTPSGSTTGSTTGGNPVVPPTQVPFNPLCRARVDVTTLNIRRGPSTDYEIIGKLSLGNEVPLVGRLGDNSWWEITSGNLRGWVSAGLTALLGNCGNVAVSAPPASPTPVATATSAQPSQPNLIISTLSGPNNIVLTGGQAAATYVLRVKNVGGSAAGIFNVTIIYPNGTSFDYAIASLDANQEANVEGVQATFTAPGTYRITILVDSSGNITESNKADNTAHLDITVVEPTPTPEGQ